MYIKRIFANIFYLCLFFLIVLLLGRNFFYGNRVLWLIPIAIVGFIWVNTRDFDGKKDRRSAKNTTAMPILTPEKEKHYLESGMTEQEIHFFRETMATTRKQIQDLEENMNQIPKLKAINLRNNTVMTAKAIFKELVKEPKKLHQGEGFLYSHLPNLLELTNKYGEINSHEVKNKMTYETLEKSGEVIDELSKLLTDDFTRLVADDFEDMDVEISLAKQSITRDNTSKETVSNQPTPEGEIEHDRE